MAKNNDNYMALEDFQTLWDDKLKPAIAMKEELGDYYNKTQTDNLLGDKQDTLVSGTNIKTINNQSLVGDGNITITGASVEPSTTTPLIDGAASVGTENAYARGDHRHPSDTTKVDKVTGKGLSTNDYTTDEKNKLSGIASGAEVNQNAFSNVVVGTTTIAADGKTDSITLVAGSNVTLTPDATNDEITIAATDTTYSAATTSAAGLMSADDKTKLNGIATGATNVTTDTVSGWGYTKNAGTVTQVKVGSTAYDPSSGVVSLPAYPTSLPASDVYSWAKASSKPSYTASDVGLGNVGNFKAVSTVASQGLTNTEKSNARANIGAGTSSFSGSYNDLSNKPTIPTNNNQLTNGAGYITGITKSMVTTALGYTPPTSDTNTWRTVQCNGTSIGNNTLNLKAGTNVSLSNSNGTITITSTDTNTWRGIQNVLTSTSTSDSLSANQGRLLANGSARDSTKLPLSGGTLTGTLSIVNPTERSTIELITKTNNPCDLWLGSNNNKYWSISCRDSSSNHPLYFYSDGVGYVLGLARMGKNVSIASQSISSSYILYVNGSVGATSYNNTSDIRKKDVIDNVNLDIKDIANAPIFKFTWLDPEMKQDVNIGTSAQYWQTVLPEIVTENDDDEKTLSMQYGVAGLVSSVALAKKVVEQEETIKAQEARIKALEDAIANI